MKIRISIATITYVMVSYGYCYAPDSTIPLGIKNYQIIDMAKKAPKTIPYKRAMKYKTKKG